MSIGEQYGLDRDEASVCDAYLEALWLAHGSYCASEQALSKQVGVADELSDLQTLLKRARSVLALIRNQEELVDPFRCVQVASKLAASLHSFPNLVNANISAMKERPAFLEARDKLRINIVQVRLWAPHRNEFIGCLAVLIEVCERVGPPERFTKRTRQARDMFERELGELYIERLHPLREAIWRDTRRDADDPPPPRSTSKFAHEVMRTLGVKFESKGISG